MRSMGKGHQLLCLWCGALGILVIGVGYWPIAHFFPPHSPMATAADIAAIYQQQGLIGDRPRFFVSCLFIQPIWIQVGTIRPSDYSKFQDRFFK